MYNKSVKRAILKNLKRYRIEREMTLHEMSSKIGVDVGHYWRLEARDIMPNDVTTHKILKALPDLLEGVA